MSEIELRGYRQEPFETIDALDGGGHLVQMATGLGRAWEEGGACLS